MDQGGRSCPGQWSLPCARQWAGALGQSLRDTAQHHVHTSHLILIHKQIILKQPMQGCNLVPPVVSTLPAACCELQVLLSTLGAFKGYYSAAAMGHRPCGGYQGGDGPPSTGCTTLELALYPLQHPTSAPLSPTSHNSQRQPKTQGQSLPRPAPHNSNRPGWVTRWCPLRCPSTRARPATPSPPCPAPGSPRGGGCAGCTRSRPRRTARTPCTTGGTRRSRRPRPP